VPRYLDVLATGGSASPASIIQQARFDMTSPQFWQGGFNVLSGMLDELEELG
jgi:oligoendopeptidase F